MTCRIYKHQKIEYLFDSGLSSFSECVVVGQINDFYDYYELSNFTPDIFTTINNKSKRFFF